MDFLCVYYNTIRGLCHCMSDKARLTMVVMGTMDSVHISHQANVAVSD